MVTVPQSAEFRLKAENAELMARMVSYQPDKDYFAAEARGWRIREVAALAAEVGYPI